MKQIYLIILFSVLLSCSTRQSSVENSKLNNTESESLAIEKKLENVFGKIDSTKILNSIGCVQGYYDYISSEYVVRIPYSIYSNIESRKEYSLGKKGNECELLVFEKDNSNLSNICTDIILINSPKPKRVLRSVQGKMRVFIGNEEGLWGNFVNNTYIHIERVVFVDTLSNNKRIMIENKYLWKVLNKGIPG